MFVFISYNKADKFQARLLATALAEQGASVWFDAWEIRPGDSILGGIENGLAIADVFALLWSKNSAKSKWVGTELRAYLRRRIDDDSLRIIPLMLDKTPLPSLVADYRGFNLEDPKSFNEIVQEIVGFSPDTELAKVLQARLLELVQGKSTLIDPLPYFVCPKCGPTSLERQQAWDRERDDRYLLIQCKVCGWNDGTEL